MEYLKDAVPLVTGFVAAVILGKALIPWLHRVKFGQHIRDDAPKTHRKKAGTPTMGGFIFILGTIAAVAAARIWRKEAPPLEEALVLGLYALMGFVGFLDDYRKVKRGRNLGLRAREKLALQVIISGAFMWFVSGTGRGTAVLVPFTGTPIDLGFAYGLFGVFVIVGMANGVNLTDGLDGLAGSVVAEGLAAYYPVALAAAAALGIPSLGPVVAGSVGAILGFLVYNRRPARVFMGDIGALALGGLLSGLAVITRTELLLLFFAFIPVVENITVIMQVISFQLFGKRIFKMTPIHHHFELLGWDEVRITRMFRLTAAAAVLVGLLAAGSVGLLGS